MDFQGFLTLEASISELRWYFWSRFLLKRISYVYTIDSACFWTSGTHEIEVAEFFMPNPPSPLPSSSNRLQISFSDFRLRYGAAPNIPRAPSVRIPSFFFCRQVHGSYFTEKNIRAPKSNSGHPKKKYHKNLPLYFREPLLTSMEREKVVFWLCSILYW